MFTLVISINKTTLIHDSNVGFVLVAQDINNWCNVCREPRLRVDSVPQLGSHVSSVVWILLVKVDLKPSLVSIYFTMHW
jgi:hypothetical protein